LKDQMRKLFQNNMLELILRLFIGVLFLFACYHKIAEPARFAKIIYGYYLFPASLINLIAIILPFVELFAGLSLVLGIYPRAAAAAINTMLLTFIVAVTINLIRGHQFDCGCFSFGGSGHTTSNVQLLFRNLLLFFLVLEVLMYDKYRMWCLRQSGGILRNIEGKA